MMKKSIWVILVSILFLTLGSSYYIFSKTMTISPEQVYNAIKQNSTESGHMKADMGRYLLYDKGLLAKTVDKRRILFFYANWCSATCIPADMNFQKNTAKIPVDVRVIRVNYNDTDTNSEERALAVKYGVVYQHTFVQIDSKGNAVTKWNGGDIDELLSHLI